MAVQISAARCGWPQIRRFCGFEHHISSNIHNFLDFVAAEIPSFLTACFCQSCLQHPCPEYRTTTPAAGRPLENGQSACTRQLHNQVQRVLLQAALAKYATKRRNSHFVVWSLQNFAVSVAANPILSAKYNDLYFVCLIFVSIII